MDRMGLQPILIINVNLTVTVTEMGMKMVRKHTFTDGMGPSPVLPVTRPVAIETMLNNDGLSFSLLKNVACKQGLRNNLSSHNRIHEVFFQMI